MSTEAPRIYPGRWVIVTLKSGTQVYDRVTEIRDSAVCLGDPDNFSGHYTWKPEKGVFMSEDGSEMKPFPDYEVFSFLEHAIDRGTASLEVYDGCTEPGYESDNVPFFIKANWNDVGKLWKAVRDGHEGVDLAETFPLLWKAVLDAFADDPDQFPETASFHRSRREWSSEAEQNRQVSRFEDFPVRAPKSGFDADPGYYVLTREQWSGGPDDRCAHTLIERVSEPLEPALVLTAGDGEEIVVFSPLYLLFWAVLEDDKGVLDFISSGNWSDEWDQCNHCFSAIRTEPDSYGWTKSFVEWDDEVVCHECILRDPEDFIAYLVERIEEEDGERPIALPAFMEGDHLPEGWHRLPVEMNSGMHRSNRCDDPVKLNAALYELGVISLWQITSQGQFETKFCCYVRHRDFEEGVELDPAKLDELVELVEESMSPGSVAANMEAALKSVSMTSAPPGHVKYVKVNADTESYSVEERDVPHEEFVEGTKTKTKEG